MAKKAKAQPDTRSELKKLAEQIRQSVIVLRPLHDLLPYSRNSRKHEDWQVAKIAASIKEFGFTNPVLCDDQGTIVAGHARVMAAHKLGLEEVPTISLGYLTEMQRRAYVIADNQLATLSSWDAEMLNLELKELQLGGFDIKLTGFDDLLKETGEGTGSGSDDYTKKIEAPIYEPKGEKPAVSELFDVTKTNELLAKVDAARDVPQEVKAFLEVAAGRHIVFDYEKIAEFYAHAPKEVQELMEQSALVIIDFNKAIENGFVSMSKTLAEATGHDEDEEKGG